MKNTTKKNGAKRILAAAMTAAMIPTAAVMIPGITANAAETEITAEQTDSNSSELITSGNPDLVRAIVTLIRKNGEDISPSEENEIPLIPACSADEADSSNPKFGPPQNITSDPAQPPSYINEDGSLTYEKPDVRLSSSYRFNEQMCYPDNNLVEQQAADDTEALDLSSVDWMKESKERAKLRERRKADFERLRKTAKTIRITQNGVYHVKNLKVYGRWLENILPGGDCYFGDWHQIGDTMSMDLLEHWTREISGRYVQLAFSFDISWGTDFPYSGVFWADFDDTAWDTVDIELGGTCRMASVKIKVGDKTVVNETNCSSHSEWKPE